MATAFQLWAPPRAIPLTAVQLQAMLDGGELHEGRGPELIDGELVEVAAQSTPHVTIKAELASRLLLALHAIGSPLMVGQDISFEANVNSVPEPDILVWEKVRGSSWLPASAVRLAAEICISSRALDLVRKPTLYAAAGVPEYWVVDVAATELLQFTEPERGAYRVRHPLALGLTVRSAVLGVEISTADLY